MYYCYVTGLHAYDFVIKLGCYLCQTPCITLNKEEPLVNKVKKKRKNMVILTVFLPVIEMKKLTFERSQLCDPGNFHVGSDSSKGLQR